jgi:hypothetical protein
MPLANQLPTPMTETTPDVATATSVTILAANRERNYLLIQNNSNADILISLSGNTLTGIVPTSSNKGIVLAPKASYEQLPGTVTNSAVTCYQASGSTINTVSVVEG